MNTLLMAAALALGVRAQPDISPQPAAGAEQSVEEQSGKSKTAPWANTGGDAASDRGAPKEPREIEAAGTVGIIVIGAGLFVLAERRRIRRFDNPGGTERPRDKSR